MTIQIDPEIANLCRSLSDSELAGLERSLQSDGCRDALVLWRDVLLDGHNRHAICARARIEYRTVQAAGIETRQDALNWVIDNQLARRNLTPAEASYLRGKRYNAEKQPIGGQIPHSKEGGGDSAPPSERTRERLSQEFGVHSRTVAEDGAFATGIDAIAKNIGESEARAIRSGKTKITKEAVRKIGKLPASEQKTALAQAKRGKQLRKARPPKTDTNVVPSDLTNFMMWLRSGSMQSSRFKTGLNIHAQTITHGVTLREDHIQESYTLLGQLIDARRSSAA